MGGSWVWLHILSFSLLLLSPDILSLAGELAEGFTKGNDGRSHPGHTQTADGLPQAGHEVSVPERGRL